MIVQGLILLSCVFGLSRPHITTFCVFWRTLIDNTDIIYNKYNKYNRHLYQNIRRPSKLHRYSHMWSKARTYLLCVFSGTGAVQGMIQPPQTIMYLFFYSMKDPQYVK